MRPVFLRTTDTLSRPRGVEMMKTKLMVVAAVMALLLCGAAMVAYAQGPGPEGGITAGADPALTDGDFSGAN